MGYHIQENTLSHSSLSFPFSVCTVLPNDRRVSVAQLLDNRQLHALGSLVPVPTVACFVTGMVAMASDSKPSFKSVDQLRVGDVVRCIRCLHSSLPTMLTDQADDNRVEWTQQQITRVIKQEAGDDFYLVNLTHAELTNSNIDNSDQTDMPTDRRQLWLTRGHPVYVRGSWFRADELAAESDPAIASSAAVCPDSHRNYLSRSRVRATGKRFRRVRYLYNFMLNASKPENCHHIVVNGVVCATMGADCGHRLAALYPHYHRKFGPAALMNPHVS